MTEGLLRGYAVTSFVRVLFQCSLRGACCVGTAVGLWQPEVSDAPELAAVFVAEFSTESALCLGAS